MNNSNYKIIIPLFLSVILFGCGRKNKSTTSTIATNGFFMKAKIIRSGKVIDFKNTKEVVVIKAGANGMEMENLHIEDKNTGYKVQIVLNRQTTNGKGEHIEESEGKKSYGILKEENGKDLTWMTSALLGSDKNGNPKGSFKITKETDFYMEGVFSFKGILVTKEGIDDKNVIEVTKGKFKARKLNYN